MRTRGIELLTKFLGPPQRELQSRRRLVRPRRPDARLELSAPRLDAPVGVGSFRTGWQGLGTDSTPPYFDPWSHPPGRERETASLKQSPG